MVCGLKDKCLIKIRLHAQNMLIILNSIVTMIGRDSNGLFMSTRIFTFDNEQHNHMSSKKYKEAYCGLELDLLVISN